MHAVRISRSAARKRRKENGVGKEKKEMHKNNESQLVEITI